MDALLDQVLPLFGGDATLALSLFVFLSATLLAFGAMAAMQVRLSVRRRAAELAVEGGAPSAEDPRSLRYASRQATQRLIDYTSKHFSTVDAGEMKELRRRLIQAGFLDPRAPVLFFLARALLAVVLAGAGFVTTPLVLAPDSALYWPAIWFQGWSAISRPTSSSTAGSRRASWSTSRASRTSWTSWWSAPMRA